jgi:hypothetical protein
VAVIFSRRIKLNYVRIWFVLVTGRWHWNWHPVFARATAILYVFLAPSLYRMHWRSNV